MESEPLKVSYDEVDPEEILIILNEVLSYLQKKKKEGKI